jgi:uncharacterized protein YcbK (DUF882 family)
MSMLAVRMVLIASFALAPAAARAAGTGGAEAPTATTPAASKPAPPAASKPAPSAASKPAPSVASKPAPSAASKPAPPKTANKKPGKKAAKNAPVVLYAVNRKETMSLRLRDSEGRPVKGLQRRFNSFLRCHHTNTQHPMNMRLARLIYQTGKHWPGHRIDVVSGYRNPSVAKNPHSPHMKGLACDFHVEGVQNTELRDYLRRTFTKVGVGYYPNSSFVHLDVRKDRSAFWIDYSGPGDRAVYSENPNDDLRTGKAESYHPTKIDESWVDEEAKPAAEDAKPEAKAELAKGPSASAPQGAETPTP